MIVGATPSEIARAAECLRRGELVAFPTETVYGLGANALDQQAVAAVFDAKGRPRFDPLIVHVAELAAARRLVAEFPIAAEKLAEHFWPGPLTMVVPKAEVIPDLVTAGCATVAIRVPAHRVARELLRLADVPVAAPSANLFGRISPTTATHVYEQLGDSVAVILDGGPSEIGVESTVVLMTTERPVLLRPGGATLEEIETVLGAKVVVPTQADLAGNTFELQSPGRLPQHYAPRTPLVLGKSNGKSAKTHTAQRVGLLAFRVPADGGEYAMVETLSPRGDLREAAANFFAALRRLDAAGLDLIVAEPFPELGLGRALNDRLHRAAHC